MTLVATLRPQGVAMAMEGVNVMENGIKDSSDAEFADMKKDMGFDESATREQVLASEQLKVRSFDF
jgi:hypothetical protein